ncbi:unnamed protein product [Cylindrotheca closterium]|uniref:Helicase-associated domain-containing protein n=1 Tax=Cylindrotheca closterium TaxID=2856 RepID=A0AAD2CF48_9STRA|nr:unnamed protein product [Cylindrotheca closterium]
MTSMRSSKSNDSCSASTSLSEEQNNEETNYIRRTRGSEHSSSQSYLSAMTAITIAAACLVSSTSAFTTSSTRCMHSSRKHTAFVRQELPSIITRNSIHPSISPTSLFAAGRTPDKEEWRAILAAFQMYKAAYGDLKVPSRFVVPSMAPWPEAAWDMPLGKKVALIRSEGKYVDDKPNRRAQLDKLGFVWRARASPKSAAGTPDITFDQIFEALVAYKKEVSGSGPLSVPVDFTVPDSEPWPESTRGLPLGTSLSKLRSPKFLKANPEAAARLGEIGFVTDSKVSANDIRFNNVFTALKRYQEIYGDMLVPQPFTVPNRSGDWPEETWGLRLGARVNAIRSQGTFVKTNPARRQMLEDLGFVWSPPESERRKRGRKSKAEYERETMEAVASVAGSPVSSDDEETADADAFVSSFDFSSIAGEPDGEESISPTWGLEKGRDVEDMAAAITEEASQPAEVEYKPELTLGESLAQAKRNAIEIGIIRETEDGKGFLKGKQSRDFPWFNDDFGDDFVFEDVVEALTLYKSFYGTFSNFTDESFVIPVKDDTVSPFDAPDDDFDFLDETMPPSRAAPSIAQFEGFDDLDLMEEFAEPGSGKMNEEEDAEEEAPAVTLQPIAEVDWPEHLGGMLLGNIVSRIRDGSLEVKHLAERKAQLDAIGFDWGDPKYFIDIPFEKAICAMFAYYLVRGDMFVSDDFVMPDVDPWPQALAGYEIGKAVTRIRQLQNFFEAYHPEKVSLLRMVEFVWFPTLALPVDPNEPEMTAEMLKLSALGHPDYAKMIDIPMGLPEKIHAEGPFHDSDDPRLWWRKYHSWDLVQDYWYQNGRRDNAFILRGLGYPQMADEHEEKYGPGLFEQIQGTLDRLENGPAVKAKDEKEELIATLKYYRDELAGCKDIHPRNLERLVEDIDIHILQLVTGKKASTIEELSEAAMAMNYEEEYVEKEEEETVENEEDYEEEEGEYEEAEEGQVEEVEEVEEEVEEINIEEELGLDAVEVSES